MRKLILGVAVSLDGFIEGPKGEYDWCLTDRDYGMTAFLKGIDAIFYGRKTYEAAKKESEKSGFDPFGKTKGYVFSTSLNEAGEMEIIGRNFKSRVLDIKQSKGKDIWLFGGAVLTSSLVNAGLVDEAWLAIHPVLLGGGKPLFQNIKKRINLKLCKSKAYDTGLVSNYYTFSNSKSGRP